jgi:hypothetical protein
MVEMQCERDTVIERERKVRKVEIEGEKKYRNEM